MDSFAKKRLGTGVVGAPVPVVVWIVLGRGCGVDHPVVY